MSAVSGPAHTELSADLLPEQIRYNNRVTTEQSVRRWAHEQGATLPPSQERRFVKFLNDWAH